MAGLGGHMPDDDLLAVFGREEMLFGFAKARSQRRRSADRRYRKQDRALLEVQYGKGAEIEDRNDNQEPLHDGHATPPAGLHRLDDVLGHLLGIAEQHHGVVAIEQG